MQDKHWAYFDARVNRTDECWLWTGPLMANGGYAQFAWRDGGVKRVKYAHVLAWERANGRARPDGMQIDHLCGVRHCVRPDHLEAVTPRVNTLRSGNPASVNARKTHCPKGHPYDEENTLRDKDGSRTCRECNRVRCRAYYHSRASVRR